MKLNILLLLIISLFTQKIVFAEAQTSIEDKIIGAAFKNIAKAYIMAVNLKQLKEDKTAMLKKIEEDKFRKRYAKTYAVISELPKEIKASYGINENMNKDQAIRKINSLDKKKVYAIIDGVPDAVIAKHFKEYLAARKQSLQSSNIAEQVKNFWERVIGNNKKEIKKLDSDTQYSKAF